MVSQGGVWSSNGAYREQFDVSQLGVGATNAVATPQVAAAERVVDATQDKDVDEENKDGNEDTVKHCYNRDSDEEEEQPRRELFLPESQATTALDEVSDSQKIAAEEKQAKKQTRKEQVKYSKRKLLAYPSLYLLAQPPPGIPPVEESASNEITGQIVHCPNQKNGRLFLVKWLNPFPVGINPDMLRTQFPSDSVTRKQLEDACERFDRKNGVTTNINESE
jgi:hypothetical protein